MGTTFCEFAEKRYNLFTGLTHDTVEFENESFSLILQLKMDPRNTKSTAKMSRYIYGIWDCDNSELSMAKRDVLSFPGWKI